MKQKAISGLPKWSLANWLFVLSGLALFTAGLVSLQTSPPANQHVTKAETILKNYHLAYPVFKNESANASLKAYVTRQVDSFLYTKNARLSPNAYLKLTYRLLHVGNRTASIEFYKNEQLPGRPQAVSKEAVSVDLHTGARLSFDYIFQDQPAANELLGRIFYNYFLHEKPGKLTPAGLKQLGAFRPQLITNYSFTDSALLFTLTVPSTGGPAMQTVQVKKELLAPILRPVLATFDRNTVATAPSKVDYSIETMPKYRPPIDPNKPMLALTFDDGPGNYTPQLLDVLAQHNAKATFFVIGQEVEKHAFTLQRMAAEGHEIGNHSLNHPNLTLLSPPELAQQLVTTQQLIQRVTGGYSPVVMRPPQGMTNAGVEAYAQSLGLKTELWSVDPQDWRYRDAAGVHGHIMAYSGDGSVVLLHDIYGTSVEAATRAIADLSAAGYQLVTLSELRQYR